MTDLEKKFHEELIKKCTLAQKECDYNPVKYLQTLERFGGVNTVKEILRKGRISEGFEKLQKAGCIELTMEATVVNKKYAELFTDDEVNSCYELLCEFGFY